MKTRTARKGSPRAHAIPADSVTGKLLAEVETFLHETDAERVKRLDQLRAEFEKSDTATNTIGDLIEKMGEPRPDRAGATSAPVRGRKTTAKPATRRRKGGVNKSQMVAEMMKKAAPSKDKSMDRKAIGEYAEKHYPALRPQDINSGLQANRMAKPPKVEFIKAPEGKRGGRYYAA